VTAQDQEISTNFSKIKSEERKKKQMPAM